MTQAGTRDILLWSDSALQRLLAAVREVWRTRASAWLPAGRRADDGLQVQPLLDHQPDIAASLANWRACGMTTDGEVSAWRGHDDNGAVALACQLVEREQASLPSSDDWALDAAWALLNDIEAGWRMTEHLLPEETGQRSMDIHPLAGAVILSHPRLGLRWLLSPTMARTLAGPGSREAPGTPAAQMPAPPWTSLLSKQRIGLSVGLGHVDIAVADLLELRSGDVVRFPALLKEPLRVQLPQAQGGGDVLTAQLGQHNGHTALKVVGKPPAA